MVQWEIGSAMEGGSFLDELKWFTDQIKENEKTMYHLAMGILGNAEDAADAAQEAILTAYQKLPSLRQKESFRPWLMRILTNECYGILRKRKKLVSLEEIHDLPAVSGGEENLQLWQAVCTLNAQLRAVVVLYYYHGFSVKEIGHILGITEANVKTRLSRARKHLRILLEGTE